jgi:transcriptional repressor NrdR
MICQKCKNSDSRVLESRISPAGDAVRRRRECEQCSYRFTTYERLEKPQLIVVKRDKTRQLYNREKIVQGLYRACQKTNIGSLEVDKLVSEVESELYDNTSEEISSADLGEMVMQKLYDLDEVAYVRFASVYNCFENAVDFEKTLQQLRERRKS